MARILDLRNSDGQLIILGGAIALPTSNNSYSGTPQTGSLRYNVGTGYIELYDGGWNAIVSGSNITSGDIATALGYTPAALDGSGRLSASQIPLALVGAVQYQGVWNASTNTPTLTSSVGIKGFYYKVSVAGSTSIDGNSAWNAGDIIIFNGTTWDKVDGISSEVTSVAGRVGAVVLSISDVSDAAPLASPAFTGTPTVPTPALDDSSTTAANTQWVNDQDYISSLTLSGAVTGSGSSSITTSFSAIASGSVLANTGDDSAAPTGTTLSALLDAVIGDVAGSTIYRGASSWIVLSLGTSGDVLQAGTSAPSWQPAVLGFNSRTGSVTLEAADITDALGFAVVGSVNTVTPDVDGNVTLTLVSDFNSRSGSVTLESSDVTDALGYTPLDSTASGLSVSFGGSVLAAPFTNGQILARFAMGFPVTLPLNLPNSTAVCLSAPTSSASLSILKNGSPIGSITFIASSTTGSFTFSADVSFAIGDILEIDGPNPADATFGNLTFAIVGSR